MALQLGALREALIEAGASDEKANRAAEELASYETRLERLDGRVALLQWMVGFNLALTVAILLLVLHR
jgi:hypothetical protein